MATVPLAEEAQPLALWIVPENDECFDSWIDRVARGHEVTRAGLFRHLGIGPNWANLDLALGSKGLASTFHQDFAAVVERLAWSVQISPERVHDTFLPCEADALLPRRLRRFACARCWYETHKSGKPKAIRREWILRASWRCRRHNLPLSDLDKLPSPQADHRGLAVLADAVLRSARLNWKMKSRPAAIARNNTAIRHLVDPSEDQYSEPQDRAYRDRFFANTYHFAPDRIAMLALAHGNRSGVARRFERLTSECVPQCPSESGGVHVSQKRPLRVRVGVASQPHTSWTSPGIWSLLHAYDEVCKRQEAERDLGAMFARIPAGVLGQPLSDAMGAMSSRR
jgi:hypothetical protein